MKTFSKVIKLLAIAVMFLFTAGIAPILLWAMGVDWDRFLNE